MEKEATRKSDWSEVIGNFVSRHFLALGAILIIPFGIFVPQPAVYLNKRVPFFWICVIIIFSIFGAKSRLAEMKSAMRCYKEMILGLIAILLATPLLGTNLLKLPEFGKLLGSGHEYRNITGNQSHPSFSLPIFGPEEFRIGLQIFCVSPCGSAFPTLVVTAVNGNRAVTLLNAILCITISVFTIPFMVVWLIPAAQKVSFSVVTMLLKIILFVLLPLLVGRISRFVPIVKTRVVKLEKPLKFLASSALLIMFWVKISQTSATGNLEKFSPWSILAVTVLGTAVTTSFLVVTYIILTLLPIPKKSVIAIAILSSCRNASVTITIIESLPEVTGDKGLMFFPVIFVCLVMIVILNTSASFFTIKEEEKEEEEESVSEVAAIEQKRGEINLGSTNDDFEYSSKCNGNSKVLGHNEGAVYIKVCESDKLGHDKEITTSLNIDNETLCTTHGPVSNVEAIHGQTILYCYKELDFTKLPSGVCLNNDICPEKHYNTKLL